MEKTNSVLLYLHEIYSCLWYIVMNIFQILLITFKGTCMSKYTDTTVVEAEIKSCSDTKIVEATLCRGEVEFVMERMSLFIDRKGNEFQERIGANDISVMFDEGLSSEEMREAFCVFDENCDGYIDAEELEKVLSALGFKEVNKIKCEKMITVYDDNGDGRIDIGEFVKVLETSFL